jgi:assimilatory nitrate reductase catalytic subunit
MKNDLKEIFKKISRLIYEREGRLTEEMAQSRSPLGLGMLPSRLQPEQTERLICGFCSTGCGLDVHLKGREAVNLTPSGDYPVNLGEACPKGWEALSPLTAQDRAATPYLRNAQGHLEPVDWDTALKIFVERFRSIQEKYGKESVAFLSTGQICTEEMAMLGALTKFGMGWLHGDGNTRQCMATAVAAYKQSFGFDAPPYTYKDFEESDVIVLIGANPCIAHPIMWQRICFNPHHPEIIVVDPRKTETAMAATQHYALKPKSDLSLFYGLAYLLIEKGWVDQSFIDGHTEGFADFRRHVTAFPPERVSQETGLSPDDLLRFAATIHHGRRVSFWWTMGINQGHESTRTAQAIINLALMTGNIGRPGTGANSITGQCNAMGSRLFSNTTNLLGGHDFTNPQHRQKVARTLGIPVENIPDQNSLAYDQIIEAVSANKIKGLWIIATNPLHSWINKQELGEFMTNLEFCVVQDMYMTTETAAYAHLVLPAAGWGEKEGTFINSERRIGLVRKVHQAPGQALADFSIFRLIMRYWGCDALFSEWRTPQEVFQILKGLTKDTPCDITGIRDYQMLAEQGGIQWPYPQGAGSMPEKERRLFEDGRFYHPNGRARFLFADKRDLPEPICEDYPFILLTGRGSSAQWHTQTRTSKSAVLRKLYPQELYVEINPKDARQLDLAHGQWVLVETRRAKVKAMASLVSSVKAGQIFMPMHYEGTNRLTFPAFDAFSRQPAYKYCAARLDPVPYYE